MAKYALIKFKINNDFYDWEVAFYSSQARARKFGIVEIFHGRESNDSSSPNSRNISRIFSLEISAIPHM